MKPTNSRICIAVPTFNSALYLSDLLEYLSKLQPYRIYVLDDASTDNTVAISKQFTDVEVIAGTENLGPTGNRNRVLGKDIGDILVFFDDDMRWRAGELLQTIQKYFIDPNLGALGFAIMDNSGKELWFGNDLENNPLFFWARPPFFSRTRLNSEQRKQPFMVVQWLLEGAFAVRSDVFTALGGFDMRFKRHQEGPDICRRIRMKGYAIGYTHDVQFTHTKPLSMFRPSELGKIMKSSIIWYMIHRGKVKDNLRNTN